MAWRSVPGTQGRLYEPDGGGAKKHNCPDCFDCQWCSDARCEVCRKKKGCRKAASVKPRRRKP